MKNLRLALLLLLSFSSNGQAQAPAPGFTSSSFRWGTSPAQGALGAGGAAAVDRGTPLMLRFLDGSLLFGAIVGHSPEVLSFRRLDNGGLVRVPWRLLDPVQSDELQTRFGYVDLSDEEVMIEADRLMVGGEELIGKIVSRTANDIVVKTATRLVFVPKLRLQAAPTVVQIPALDVYTKDELYASEVARIAPETASQQVELAQYCERILAFDKAYEHWRLAADAVAAGAQGEPFEVDIEAAKQLAARKAEAQAELDHLQEIDSLRARRHYDEALELCESFRTVFPESQLVPELQKKRKRVEKAREEALSEDTARSWHRWSGKLARQAARTMTLEDVLAYLDGGLHEEIQAKVLADVHKSVGESLEPDDVLNAWVKREPGRWRKASYGLGTWLLGEGRAHAGLHDEEAGDPAGTTPRTDEEKAIADKIKRYLENQKSARASRASGGDADERNAFWESFPLNAKEFWILAYYAENSGDMELRDPTARPCPSCAGTGVREILYTGAGGSGRGREGSGGGGARSQKVACPTCHYVGIVRRVSFR